MNKIRTRFAPSPTGYLHVGGARTALFNFLFARHSGGEFILRIEDTDFDRSTGESADEIIESLKWLNINWDEGPSYQSERLNVYKAAVDKLLETGHAYPCFCSEERLEKIREEAKAKDQPIVYDRCCLALSDDERKKKIATGEKYTVRIKVPDSGFTEFDDAILGKKSFENSLIGDFVIVRSDGIPTYNLSCAIDDNEMGITHVIRGDDHTSNTPKQLIILNGLGVQPPVYGHVPLILGPDKTRLSKRHGATSVLSFRDAGYLPEAFVNFFALLGWNPGENDREIFSMQEMIERFTLDRINKAAAVFDQVKLQWMNGNYIRSFDKNEITGKVKEFFGLHNVNTGRYNEKSLAGIISLGIERSKTLAEFEEQLKFFFDDNLEYDAKGIEKNCSKPEVWDWVNAVAEEIKNCEPFTIQELETRIRAYSEKNAVSLGKIIAPIRLALTGKTASPGIFEIIFYLGKEETAKRIKEFIAGFKK